MCPFHSRPPHFLRRRNRVQFWQQDLLNLVPKGIVHDLRSPRIVTPTAPEQRTAATVKEFVGLFMATYRSQVVCRLLLRSDKFRWKHRHKLCFVLLREVSSS